MNVETNVSTVRSMSQTLQRPDGGDTDYLIHFQFPAAAERFSVLVHAFEVVEGKEH
jgi:hypothetical protein